MLLVIVAVAGGDEAGIDYRRLAMVALVGKSLVIVQVAIGLTVVLV
jgi:hypothetical protein